MQAFVSGVTSSESQLSVLGPLVLVAWSLRSESQRDAVVRWVVRSRPDTMVLQAVSGLSTVKRALKHLKAGGTVLVLRPEHPTEWRFTFGNVERVWHPMLGALVRLSRASVVPVVVHGQVFAGTLLPAKRLQKIEDHRALTEFIRSRILMQDVRVVPAQKPKQSARSLPVSPPSPVALLQREIETLRQGGHGLVSQSSLSVFVAGATQIPHLLHEIGRQRELSFREAGEGTGREIDLDRYDQHYLHLFLWDADQASIAGAYRLGCADEILPVHGARGLYTQSLFRLGRKFLSQLDDAVELGRSFIARDYQRDAVAMPLLWKGIVAWLADNPRYRRFFGPVSISQDYAPQSRRLMVRYLRKHHGHRNLSRHVQPRRPYFALGISPAEKSFLRCGVVDAEDCSEVVSGIEADGKGFPTLLRHYLKLNGRFLSFNVDPDFSDVLDGLVMVDMLETDPRLPARLMGREKWEQYLAHHLHKR